VTLGGVAACRDKESLLFPSERQAGSAGFMEVRVGLRQGRSMWLKEHGAGWEGDWLLDVEATQVKL
jgi:hypothetical protein